MRRGVGVLATTVAVFGHSADAFVAKAHRVGQQQPGTAMRSPTASQPSLALFGMWDDEGTIEGKNRIKACIPYLLPLIDGDQFGHYIYQRIPPLGALDEVTIGPLSDLAHSIPFLTLGFFMALTLGTRFNMDMDRSLRFSAQQAALLDVALLVPQLIAACFEEDPVPRSIAEPCSNFVWYAYTSVTMYCVISNLRGRKPDNIPYVSSSAELMVGPF